MDDKNENVHFGHRSKRSFFSDAWVKVKSVFGIKTVRLKLK